MTAGDRLADGASAEAGLGQEQAQVEKIDARGRSRRIEKAAQGSIAVGDAAPPRGAEEEVAVEVDVVAVAAPQMRHAVGVEDVHQDQRGVGGEGGELVEQGQLHGGTGEALDTMNSANMHQRATGVASAEPGDVGAQQVLLRTLRALRQGVQFAPGCSNGGTKASAGGCEVGGEVVVSHSCSQEMVAQRGVAIEPGVPANGRIGLPAKSKPPKYDLFLHQSD